MRNMGWTPRQTLINMTRHDMRKENYRWDVHTTMDCLVSDWTQKKIFPEACEYYRTCSEKAFKRLISETGKRK